jgi:hypothetical protein
MIGAEQRKQLTTDSLYLAAADGRQRCDGRRGRRNVAATEHGVRCDHASRKTASKVKYSSGCPDLAGFPSMSARGQVVVFWCLSCSGGEPGVNLIGQEL